MGSITIQNAEFLISTNLESCDRIITLPNISVIRNCDAEYKCDSASLFGVAVPNISVTYGNRQGWCAKGSVDRTSYGASVEGRVKF